MFESRPEGRGFEPHQRHCVVSLSKNIYLSLVLVQPRKTRPFITEKLLMGRKESKQTNVMGSGVYLLDFFCSGIQFNLLLSPYPCFISLLYLDLYVLGDDALIS